MDTETCIPGDTKQDPVEVFHPSETDFSSLMVSYPQNSKVEEETLLLLGSAWGSAYSPCHQPERQVGLVGTGAWEVITPLMFNVLKNH